MITQEDLKAHLHYDKETGVFTWIAGKFKGKTAGWQAETANIIMLNKCRMTAKRAAWLYVVGCLPDAGQSIKSKDQNPFNDKWDNITMSYSGMTKLHQDISAKRKDCVDTKPPRNSTTGVKGVSFHKQSRKYRATISLNGKSFNLGYYLTIKEAEIAITTARHRVSAL